MRNNELLPYDTIVQATSGEPEAVNTVLQYYGRRIRDIVNIGLHFFLKDVRPMLPPVMNRSIVDA